MTIKAIETRYAGCRFRSRLEARWAVFFDTLGITWEYEPEGYEVPRMLGYFPCRKGDTVRYLPDFWLPNQRIWFEVKGTRPETDEVWHSFAHAVEGCYECGTDCTGTVIMAVGNIPDPRLIDKCGLPLKLTSTFDLERWGDYHYAWTQCKDCGSLDVQFDGRSGRNYCKCAPLGDDKRYNADAPTILKAYAAARSARFEHGEAERW